jgi:sterol desaturase/sphingolipid hydroxylase (fatty acid hydroxylase superfamily)
MGIFSQLFDEVFGTDLSGNEKMHDRDRQRAALRMQAEQLELQRREVAALEKLAALELIESKKPAVPKPNKEK